MTDAPPPTQYRLSLDVRIEELDPTGRYTVSGNQLQVRDHRDLGAMDFLKIAGVLGRFHDLTQSIIDGDAEDAEEAPAPVVDDAPFGRIQSWPVPPFRVNPVYRAARGLNSPFGYLPQQEINDRQKRVDKARAKYAAALAALCGCNDTATHERNL